CRACQRRGPGSWPLHHRKEPFEYVLVVLRARASLGVVLDGEDWKLAVRQPLNRVVVQVRHADEVAARFGNRVRVDLELVVLRRDMPPSRPMLQHGTVPSM